MSWLGLTLFSSLLVCNILPIISDVHILFWIFAAGWCFEYVDLLAQCNKWSLNSPQFLQWLPMVSGIFQTIIDWLCRKFSPTFSNHFSYHYSLKRLLLMLEFVLVWTSQFLGVCYMHKVKATAMIAFIHMWTNTIGTQYPQGNNYCIFGRVLDLHVSVWRNECSSNKLYPWWFLEAFDDHGFVSNDGIRVFLSPKETLKQIANSNYAMLAVWKKSYLPKT